MYSQEKLIEIIELSCADLMIEQPMLFDEKNNINERTISGELNSKISNHIKGYHVNAEYNRMIDEYGSQIPKRINLDPNIENKTIVYPDIIIHKQDVGTHNLLIIEIKMFWKNGEKQADITKLNRYVEELNYQFGLYLELGKNGIEEMEWFSK